jgi:hypothetical protein
MKMRALEFLRWQKSAQAAESKGRHLRLLAKVANDSGWSGDGDGAWESRSAVREAIFRCEHGPL